MKVIETHLTDPAIVVESNTTFEDVHFKGTGSAYGRFIFTDRTALRIVGQNVTVKNCSFTGLDIAVSI